MPDFRSYFEQKYLGSWDCLGRDVTVIIDRVEATEVTNTGNKKTKAPLVYFRRPDGSVAPKPMIFNKTNARSVAALYGNDTTKWVGKRITIYPTKTTFANQEVDCLRVRPLVPAAGKGAAAVQPTVVTKPDAGELCEAPDPSRDGVPCVLPLLHNGPHRAEGDPIGVDGGEYEGEVG